MLAICCVACLAGWAALNPGAPAHRPSSFATPRTEASTANAEAKRQQTHGRARQKPAPAAVAHVENAEAEPAPLAFDWSAPRAPLEAYTGDPEGQALLDKLVETEQETIQPEDLVEEPPRPRLELHKLPAYQAERMDADGNLN